MLMVCVVVVAPVRAWADSDAGPVPSKADGLTVSVAIGYGWGQQHEELHETHPDQEKYVQVSVGMIVDPRLALSLTVGAWWLGHHDFPFVLADAQWRFADRAYVVAGVGPGVGAFCFSVRPGFVIGRTGSIGLDVQLMGLRCTLSYGDAVGVGNQIGVLAAVTFE